METSDPIKSTESSVYENTSTHNPQTTKTNYNRKVLLILGSFIMIVFIIIIGFSIRNFLNSEVKIVYDDTNTSVSTSDSESTETDIVPTLTPTPPLLTENIYIKLSNLKLHPPIEDEGEKIFRINPAELKYYDWNLGSIFSGNIYSIGKADDWNLYFIELIDLGPGFAYPSVFYISNGVEKYITFQGNTGESDWLIDGVNLNLLTDVKIINKIEGLPDFPDKISLKNEDFDLPTSTVYIEGNFDFGSDFVKHDQYNGLDLNSSYKKIRGISSLQEYEKMNEGLLTESAVIPNYYSRSTFLLEPTIRLAKFYASNFKFMTDDQRVVAKWSDGRSEDLIYSPNSSGCGGYGSGINVIKSSAISESDLTKVGKTSFGDNLYQIKDPNSKILSYFYYAQYFPFRDPKINAPGEQESDGTEITNPLTYDEFVMTPNHFLYRDGLGDYIVFTNQEFAELAECGKPVVYLYPEKETQVSVKVDAKIRISDPDYGVGWEVTATPNGEIVWNGQQFDYLYWDGLGNGIYPDVSNVGVVVNTNEAEKTIREHLSLMNLNEKEINDFVEFWIPLMPNTPYVKITWLGTNDMNALARMDINPRPNTLIRVFMDYEGLYQKRELKPQQFVSVERKGFTVVEWGGLLKR